MNDESDSGAAVTTRLAGRVVQVQPVLVTDFQMPFASMVVFMVKWAIAAIPAIIILLSSSRLRVLYSAGSSGRCSASRTRDARASR